MRFRLVVLTLFGSISTYIYWSVLSLFASPFQWIGLAVLIGMIATIVWVPLVSWQSDREETTPRDRLFFWLAFSFVGFLSSVLWLTVLRDLVFVVSLPFSHVLMLRTPAYNAGLLALSAALFCFGLVQAHRPRIFKTEVRLPGLPKELEGLRLVQISDLHIGPTIRKAQVERIVSLIAEADPDLVFLTGDFADGSPKDLATETVPLTQVRARHGLYYVPGNHEYYWGGIEWVKEVERLGFKALINQNVVLQVRGRELAILGVPDPASARVPEHGGPDFKRAAKGIPETAFPCIALCHQPGFEKEAEAVGVDLILSGHTHGGQFFPWTLAASAVHRYNVGLHFLGKMAIYVNRGTGYWGPPQRIGTHPEVSLLILTAQARAANARSDQKSAER